VSSEPIHAPTLPPTPWVSSLPPAEEEESNDKNRRIQDNEPNMLTIQRYAIKHENDERQMSATAAASNN